VTNFKISTSTIRPLRFRAGAAAAALGVAIVIAGCGSSGGSSTITVGNENTADNALIKAGESASTSSTSTATVKTPTTGPLSKEPTVTVPTGPAPAKLETKELIAGTGAEAKAGDTVTVNYVGVLYKGGKEFDASWKRHETFSFALGKGQVIPGWDQGIVGMKVGSRRELVIPSALAYGAKGSPPTIPANAPLVFVVDLLGV
jgi:peptidylprolyl isomerase